VDDDPQVLHFLAQVLQVAGYGVAMANSGAVALKMIEQQVPDLLVLDLALPEVDGFEILRSLRDQTPGLPTLVISGFQGFPPSCCHLVGSHRSARKTHRTDNPAGNCQ
jgi:DNA-binding response OmpR family regulator